MGADMKRAEKKHTPGPWRVIGADVADPSGNYAIARCGSFNSLPKQEVEANARLIAAAPELLEALKLIAKEWPHKAPADCYSTGPKTGDLIQDYVACPGCTVQRTIEAAISKAETTL